MRVVTIPCRIDNFSYLVGADNSPEVAVVDPCDSAPVIEALRERQLQLVAILNTHHHGDHVGGNLELLAAFPNIPVYAHGSDRGRIPGQTHELQEGDELTAAGIKYRILFVPGHTSGHIAYVTDTAAFVGDTLFGAGCGRLFEGTPAQMNRSLNKKIASLPDSTQLYFAHEYTESNLRFAQSIEPENLALLSRIQQTRELRQRGQWSTPSTLGVEKQTNPFLRVNQPTVIQAVGQSMSLADTPLTGSASDAVFAALRRAKDHF